MYYKDLIQAFTLTCNFNDLKIFWNSLNLRKVFPKFYNQHNKKKKNEYLKKCLGHVLSLNTNY